MICNRTYSHLAVTESTSNVTPCCQFHNYQKDQVAALGEVSSLNEVLKSSRWDAIRKQIETGQAETQCSNCFSQEQQGLESSRTYYNRRVHLDGTFELQDLEIALDFTCNMICRICKPSQSSKWSQAASLVEQLKQFDPHHYSMANGGQAYASDIQRVLGNTDFSKLKRIRFVGGEPLYSRYLVEFLERIDSHAGLENVEISMNTNGSIIPSGEKATLLHKCKRLDIQISIDAIGDLANCIRPGVAWSKIEQNVPKWVQFVGSDNLIQIHATISLMNMNRMQELADFATASGGYLTGHKLFDPAYLRMDQIAGLDSWRIIGSNEWYDQFNGMLGSELFPHQLSRFVQAMNLMDAHHGIKFSDANEEIWELVQDQLNR